MTRISKRLAVSSWNPLPTTDYCHPPGAKTPVEIARDLDIYQNLFNYEVSIEKSYETVLTAQSTPDTRGPEEQETDRGAREGREHRAQSTAVEQRGRERENGKAAKRSNSSQNHSQSHHSSLITHHSSAVGFSSA